MTGTGGGYSLQMSDQTSQTAESGVTKSGSRVVNRQQGVPPWLIAVIALAGVAVFYLNKKR